MDMLESNYRTWCAQNDIPVEDGPVVETEVEVMEVEEETNGDEEKEWDGFMDVDEEDVPAFFKEEADLQEKQVSGKGSKRRRKGQVAELVREKVRRVLEDKTQLAEKRARTCDEGDFLSLLWEFNQEGLHFS